MASLTLLSTSPGSPEEAYRDLPGMVEERFAGGSAEPDWSDRAAVVDSLVAGERACAGARFDEPYWRDVAERSVDRGVDIASYGNHFLVDDGPPWRHRLGDITAPTLVVHGTDDPLFPFPHGRALAAEIPGAELVAMPGVGHEPPPPAFWDLVLPAVVAHTARP